MPILLENGGCGFNNWTVEMRCRSCICHVCHSILHGENGTQLAWFFYFLLIYLVVELYFNHNTDNIKLQYQHYAQNNTYSGKVHLLITIFYIIRRFCPISSPPIHSFSLDNFILHVSYLLPSKIRYSAL